MYVCTYLGPHVGIMIRVRGYFIPYIIINCRHDHVLMLEYLVIYPVGTSSNWVIFPLNVIPLDFELPCFPVEYNVRGTTCTIVAPDLKLTPYQGKIINLPDCCTWEQTQGNCSLVTLGYPSKISSGYTHSGCYATDSGILPKQRWYVFDLHKF